jgi:hypothetical protein
MFTNVTKGTTAPSVPTGAAGAPEARVIARAAMALLDEVPADLPARALDRTALQDRRDVVREALPEGERQVERIAAVIVGSPGRHEEESDDLIGTATDARLLRHCLRLA